MAEFTDDDLQMLAPTEQGAMTSIPSPRARRAQLEARQARLTAFMKAQREATPLPQGQMVSGHYVAPHALEFLARPLVEMIGGYQQSELDKEAARAGVAEQAALRDSLQRLGGSEGAAATPFGSRDMPRQDAVPGVAPAAGADRRAVIASLMDNPAAGTLGHELLKDDLISAPARADARAAKAEEARLAREAREAEAERQRIEKGEQAAAARVAQADRDQKHNATLLAVKAMGRGGGAPAPRAPVGWRWTADGSGLEPIPGGPADPASKPEKAVKLTAAQQKAYDDSEALLGHIDNALGLIGANPNAVGFKTVVPDVALARIDPEGVMTRSAVAGLSAEKVHQLSGAAVSPAEFARLRPYLPASGDAASTVKDKLTNLRAEVERIKAIHARGPTTVQPSGAPVPGGAPRVRTYNPATGRLE